MDVFVAFLVLGATARLTRLIVLDTIAAPPIVGTINWLSRRQWFAVQDWFTSLVSCSWCVSIWVASPITTVAYFLGDSPWFVIPALALTVSYVVALCAQWFDPGNRFTHD